MKVSQRTTPISPSYFFTEEKPPGVMNVRLMYPAYIVLVLTLTASITVGVLLQRSIQEVRRGDFERSTLITSQRLKSTIQRHTQVTQTMVGLYETFGIVIRDVFEIAATPPVRVFPSISSISYVGYVPLSGAEEFVYNARRERYFDYRLVASPQARERLYMLPGLYIVPFPTRQNLSGFDFAGIPQLQTAIITARDSNRTTLSEPFRFGQDSTVMMLIEPVFKRTFRQVPESQAKEDITAADYYVQSDTTTLMARNKNFAGALCIEIQVSRFLREAFGELEHAEPGIIVRCVDKSNNNTLLYTSSPQAEQADQFPEFQRSIPIRFANRDFVLDFVTTTNFGNSIEKNLPLITAGVSIIASFSLFAFLVSLLSGRARAQFLAERITRSQRRIFDSSQDMICVTTLNYTIRSINPGMVETLQYEHSECIGASLLQFFDQNTNALDLFKVADGERINFETPMRKKDGSLIWVSWNSTVSDDAIYSIGRDVTAEKQHQQQLRLRTKQVELAQQITIESAHSKNILMSNLSFYARTALSGVLGYIQLLSTKNYESQEEESLLLRTIQRDSDLLMSRMHDVVTIAERDTAFATRRGTMMRIPILDSMAEFEAILAERLPDKGITFAKKFDADVGGYILNLDKEIFHDALVYAIDSMTDDNKFSFVRTTITLNTHESVAEFEFLFPVTESLTQILATFRRYSLYELIAELEQDTNDVMFRLAQAHSLFKMGGAHIMADTVDDEYAVMFLSIPIRKMIHIPKPKEA